MTRRLTRAMHAVFGPKDAHSLDKCKDNLLHSPTKLSVPKPTSNKLQSLLSVVEFPLFLFLSPHCSIHTVYHIYPVSTKLHPLYPRTHPSPTQLQLSHLQHLPNRPNPRFSLPYPAPLLQTPTLATTPLDRPHSPPNRTRPAPRLHTPPHVQRKSHNSRFRNVLHTGVLQDTKTRHWMRKAILTYLNRHISMRDPVLLAVQ
jgi:hypothetical protein